MKLNNKMSYTDIVKELENMDSRIILKLSTACDWYWSKGNLEKELTKEQENDVIELANDIYMTGEAVDEIRVMDKIVERINKCEDTEEYINNGMYDEKETIYEESFGY